MTAVMMSPACHCYGWSLSTYGRKGGGTSVGGVNVYKGGVNVVRGELGDGKIGMR